MSEEQASAVFVDVGPEAYLPAILNTNEDTFGGLQATKMEVGGAEIMVYQEVDKSYLEEYLEVPIEKTCDPTTTPAKILIEIETIPQPETATVETPQIRTKTQSNGVQCPKDPPVQQLLIEHIPRSQGVCKGKPFACYLCEYMTINKTMFQEHLFMHEGVKPYKCKHCDHTSGSKKNLKNHELRHQDGYRLKCPDCLFVGRNPQSLSKHMKSNCISIKTCEMSDFTSSNNAELEEHKKFHKQRMPRPRKKCKQLNNDKFECQICKWSSKSVMKILLHLIHHPKQKVNTKVVDITILKEHGIME